MNTALVIGAALLVSLGIAMLGIWLREPLAGIVLAIAGGCLVLKLAEKTGWA